MADGGSADGLGSSTGMGIGRDRFHQKDQTTYLGEDSQTRPLEDLVNRVAQSYNQSQAQNNLLFGGPGYGGSFVPYSQRGGSGAPGGGGQGPRTGTPPLPGSGPTGTGTGPRGNPLPGQGGSGGGLQLPNPGESYSTYPGRPQDDPTARGAATYTKDPQTGRSATLPEGMEADVVQNPSQTPTRREKWDPIAVNPARDTPPPPTTYPPINGAMTQPPGMSPGTYSGSRPGLYIPGYTQPPSPYNGASAGIGSGAPYGGEGPAGASTGTEQIASNGGGDPSDNPGAPPSGTANSIHNDPRYYSQDQYNPADPNRWNDEDNARPTAIRPQGSDMDAWSTSPDWRPEAPTGGLYGGLTDMASGSFNPLEQSIIGGLGSQYLNPLTGLDNAALSGYGQFASGQRTGDENATRSGYGGLASSSFLDDPTSAGWAQQALGQRTRDESRTRGGYGQLANTTLASDPTSQGFAQQALGTRTGDEQALQRMFQAFGGGPNAAEAGVQAGYAGMPTRTGLENSVLSQFQGLPTQTGRENDVYGRYQGLANDPRLAADIDLTNRLGTFMSTQGGGRGEDEAYGQYKTMLGPDSGYSAAQRNAIEQEGMNAARAGFDTARSRIARNASQGGNQSAIAASLAQLAKGQASTLAGQARQNQIANANETQRRNEVGAAGMADLARIANQRGEFGLGALAGQNQEYGRRVLAGLEGMNTSNQQQRQLQLQSLAGQTAYNDAGRQLQAASLAGQERGNAAQRQYGQTAMEGLNRYNDQGRGYTMAGLQGLAGRQDATRAAQQAGLAGLTRQDEAQRGYTQAGLQGLGSRYDAGTARQQSGLAGLARQDEAQRGYQQAGLAGMTNAGNEAQARRDRALAGLSAQAQGGRGRQQQGLAGLQGLYNSQQQAQQSQLEMLRDLLKTQRENYSETFSTQGQGGINV